MTTRATKLTIAEMQGIAEGRGGRCLSTEIVAATMNLAWECARKHRWVARPHNVKRGSWCPICRSSGFKIGRGSRVQSKFDARGVPRDAVDKATACRIVICDPSDSHFSDVQREFGVDHWDCYKAIKREFLRNYNCGNHVNPRIFAATSFYFLSKGKGPFFSQKAIARFLGTTDVSIRLFAKKMRAFVSKRTLDGL